MHRTTLIVLVLAAGTLLGGCGQKGPLVMPKDAPPPMQAAPASTAPAPATTAPAPAEPR